MCRTGFPEAEMSIANRPDSHDAQIAPETPTRSEPIQKTERQEGECTGQRHRSHRRAQALFASAGQSCRPEREQQKDDGTSCNAFTNSINVPKRNPRKILLRILSRRSAQRRWQFCRSATDRASTERSCRSRVRSQRSLRIRYAELGNIYKNQRSFSTR